MKFLISIYPWENPVLYESDLKIDKGEKVIVATEFSNDLGLVEEVDVKTEDVSTGKILRIATKRDREVFEEQEKERNDFLALAKKEARDLALEIKLIDVRISLDGRQAVFAFTADGRVDFRELVKKISKEIGKNVRMQQIGSREEARRAGGFGICGRGLCCINFAGNIPSITTEMARMQQVSQRGSERISGLCGRLMCCLAYEAEQYRELLSGMPEMYSVVNTAMGKGTVMEINVAKQEVRIKLENGEYVIIKKGEIK